MPRVSVLMPCYNASATLVEALESLACQTMEDFEIVLVDDGSTDGSYGICADWAQHDQRLRLLFQPHGGIITALNYGLKNCRGDYIARMDADDHSLPRRLEVQTKLLDEQPEIAVAGCLVAGFPTEQVREGFQIYLAWLNSLVRHGDICREIFVESPLAHPSVMIRRVWLERVNGYYEQGWPEDYDLWLRLYLAGAKFTKAPEVLVEWRESLQRLTRVDHRYSVENFLRAKAYYLKKGPLLGRDAVIIWGAGIVGRRLGKQLQHQDVPLVAFVDIDPRKIGKQRCGQPILAPEELPGFWKHFKNPVLVAVVGARGARQLIRSRLTSFGLIEGQNWWSAA